MPDIIRSEVLGFCMGVKRAVDMAEEALLEHEGKKIFMLGPLIHNEQALQALYDKGLKLLSEDAIEKSCDANAIVIIRAHGTTPTILERINKTGALVIDTTCPKVKASQKRAEKYALQGAMVFIAGDLGHGEVTSISSYANEKAIVIKDRTEALSFLESQEFLANSKKFDTAILISQTTIRKEEYDEIAEVLQNAIPSLQVFNTICSATKERQVSLRELAKKVDGILVIGGKHSANTQRLFSLAQELHKQSALIESSDEIPESFYHLENIGITAGASTAIKSIEEVEERLRGRELLTKNT